VLNVRGYL